MSVESSDRVSDELEVGPSPSGGSLRAVALRSGTYLAGREAVGMVIRLLGLVLVVRQIGPSQFGIYSGAAAFVFFAATLAQMGAEVFLVRSPGPLPRRRYDEVFTFLLCTSTLIVVAGLALSYAVGPWLRPVGVVGPVRVLLLSVPINILWAPAQACIERKFAYRRMGALELGGDIALYAVAVPLAYAGDGAWSLIAGYFAWQGWLLAGSLALSGLRPRVRWSSETARALLRHGSTYSVSTWIFGLRSSLVTLIVGSFAGATGLGLVNFAQRLVATLNFTDRGVHRVGMVAISRFGTGAPQRLASALEDGTLLLLAVAALPFVAFGLVARWAVPAVFGPAWLPALPVYGLLALWAVLRVPATVQRTLLFARGRNAPPAVTSAIELVIVTALSIVIVRSIGIVGYGLATVVGVASTAWTLRAARQLVRIRAARLVVPLLVAAPPALAPLLPSEWGLCLLVPAIAVLLSRPGRSEARTVVAAARAVTRRRLVGKTSHGTPLRSLPAGSPGDMSLEASGAPAGGAPPAWHDPFLRLLEPDAVTGLPSAGMLLARLGRMLGAARRSGRQLLVVALDIAIPGDRGLSSPDEEHLVAAAAALRGEVRFDDPVARVGPSTFVVAVPLVGDADAAEVVEHLRAAVVRSLGASTVSGPRVRVGEAVVPLPCGEDADKLVREVVDAARG